MAKWIRIATPTLLGATAILALAAGPVSIRVDANLVLIPVSVTDSTNHPIVSIAADRFRIFEGGAEQKVLRVSTDDAPLSVGIVFDTSASMEGKLNGARKAVSEFLKSANPADEFFLVSFSDTARVAVPFTSDPDDLDRQLSRTTPKGKTALLDALYLARDAMKSARNPRRALLVISDGGDNHSRYTATELRRVLQETDLWVYAISICPAGSQPIPEAAGDESQLLSDLAEATGGRHYSVQRSSDLSEAAAKIGLALRNRYLLVYCPSTAGSDGKYHPVHVKLVAPRGFHLTWRPGYYAPNSLR